MPDLRDREKIDLLDTLTEVAVGKRTLAWFEGRVPSAVDRTALVEDLAQRGLIERFGRYAWEVPRPFRLTETGRAFLRRLRSRIGYPTAGPATIAAMQLGRIEFLSRVQRRADDVEDAMTREAARAHILHHLFQDYFKRPVGTRAIPVETLRKVAGVSVRACNDAIVDLIRDGMLVRSRVRGTAIMLDEAGVAHCERQRRSGRV